MTKTQPEGNYNRSDTTRTPAVYSFQRIDDRRTQKRDLLSLFFFGVWHAFIDNCICIKI